MFVHLALPFEVIQTASLTIRSMIDGVSHGQSYHLSQGAKVWELVVAEGEGVFICRKRVPSMCAAAYSQVLRGCVPSRNTVVLVAVVHHLSGAEILDHSAGNTGELVVELVLDLRDLGLKGKVHDDVVAVGGVAAGYAELHRAA